MEEDFRALLLADSGVASFAGSRVGFGERPQGGGCPAIVLNTISGAEGLTMKGPDGLLQSRVQVDTYALSYAEAKAAARAIVSALHGYRGGGFRLVEHVSTRDSREGGTNEAERPYRVSLDFMAHWRAT